jgi:hypothetical protein
MDPSAAGERTVDTRGLVSAAEARKISAATNGQEVDPTAVRAWAAAQTPLIKLGNKGRIPAEVTARYLAATQQPEG